MPRQTQAQTLSDIYSKLNALAEIACHPCDRCAIEVKKFYAFTLGQESLSVSSYLETFPSFAWVNSLNGQVGQFVQLVNSQFTPRSLTKIHQFLSRVFIPVTPPIVRSEAPLTAYITALQLSYLFIFSDPSLLTKPQRVVLPPKKGNQKIDLQDAVSVLVEVLDYPKELGRFFTGHESPYNFVIPNQFWVFFYSATFQGIISFFQIHYCAQVFTVPTEATILYLQAPQSATLRATLIK